MLGNYDKKTIINLSGIFKDFNLVNGSNASDAYKLGCWMNFSCNNQL